MKKKRHKHKYDQVRVRRADRRGYVIITYRCNVPDCPKPEYEREKAQ